MIGVATDVQRVLDRMQVPGYRLTARSDMAHMCQLISEPSNNRTDHVHFIVVLATACVSRRVGVIIGLRQATDDRTSQIIKG